MTDSNAAPAPSTRPGAVPHPPPRDTTFDRIKGIGIAEVMTHHTLGVTIRKFAAEGSPNWWTMVTLSQILHFAVPVFLFVSAILLTRSIAKSETPDWTRYLLRRLRRTGIPFLVWSAVYLSFRIAIATDAGDSNTIAVRATALTTPVLLQTYLLWGKAYFHLYFFAILIQLSMALPLLIGIVRKCPPRFPVIALSALGAQALVHHFHGNLFQLPYPAATLLWYLPAVLIGVWIGLHWKHWPELWPKVRPFAFAGSAIGFASYLPLALRVRTGQPVDNFTYQIAATIWTTCLGGALLGTASRIPKTLGNLLGWLGERSLGLFVVHPLALYFLGGPKITGLLQATPAPSLVYAILLFATSIASVELIRRTPLRHLLLAG